MKILLTGGTGMCGLNILEHSKAEEHNILSPTSDELDLLKVSRIKDYLSEHRPDLIVHAAGLVAGIEFNIKNPVRALTDNSYIALNLIKTAQDVGIENLINLGSSCMYPRLGKNPLDESQILTGELEPTNEGYAIAKILLLYRRVQNINGTRTAHSHTHMGKPWYMALTQLAGLWRSSGAIPQALIRGQQSLSAALEGSGSPHCHWLAWLHPPPR